MNQSSLALTGSEPASPFDKIRHMDAEDEWWSARELAPPLGYVNWQNFAALVERAKLSVQNAGMSVLDNFTEVSKVLQTGQPVRDWRLSRYACYVIAMNGDPRKSEIAAAQAYFAIKTREAELLLPNDYESALEALLRTERARKQVELERDRAWGKATQLQAVTDEQARQIERDAPKVGYVTHFVQPTADSCILRDVASRLGVSEHALWRYLVEHGRVYTKAGYKGKREYRAYAQWKTWFELVRHHDVPERDGMLPTTLRVTPVGAEGIRLMLERSPLA